MAAKPLVKPEVAVTIAFTLLLALVADDGVPPGAVKLLAGDDVYKKAAGTETLVDGIVERTPTTGRPLGTTRFNVFRLRFQDATGKEDVRELYVPDKAFLISNHLGKKVRVAGKLVETKLDKETLRELWPAWMQPLTGPMALLPGPDGVFARCDWQPEEARKRGAKQYIFRKPEQVAEAMRVIGSAPAPTASALLAKRFNLPAIDWDKQMVVCVCAGLQAGAVEGLAITSVKQEGGILRVRYRLVQGSGGGLGFGYPAQSVLVPRSDAEVRFEQEAEPKKR